MNKAGFMLLEAILTVVIVSICLTYVCQSLLTNYRTGLRFGQSVVSILVMENRLGLLYATTASGDQLDTYPETLEAPYDKFSVSARTDTLNDHLKKVDLTLNWPQGHNPGHMDATTIIYSQDAN